MMGDIIMTAGIYVFAVLFIFLLFVFFSAVIGYFVQPKYRKYQPDVTVLIPAYNEEKNIGKCLEHVFASHYPLSKMDVIVVDDGSADNTRSIVKQFQKKYPRKIRLVNGTHQGKSVSLNHGVKIARTEIIMTIDADTFIDPGSLRLLVQPFQDPLVGATNGSCVVANPHSLVGVFQRIEYHYNNLIRKSFSSLFKTGIWFFGAFACYRRSVIEKIGYFKTDTLTEDMDTAMEIYLSGYRTINVWDALGHTVAPDTLSAFFKQRTRWWMGVLQSLAKNRALFHYKSSPSILFLFVNQYWWSFYAVISFPLIAYQVYYWLPYNTETFMMLFMYLFRWFSVIGPFYVIYMIPEWGISLYSIFGVMSGIISVFLIVWSIYTFRDKVRFWNFFAIFFYFPYTIVLNLVIMFSLVRLVFGRRRYFIK